MKIKAGVKLAGVKPETVVGMMVVNDIINANFPGEFVVTSVLDGKHKVGSKHYEGYAFDVRIRYLKDNEQIDTLASAIRGALNGQDSNQVGDWDVVVEATHIHVEFDPA